MSTTEPTPQTAWPVDAAAGTPSWPDTGSASPDYGWSRYAWRHLDREQARVLWGELTDWVTWLRARYQLGHTIPPCWYRHGVIVEELTALMAAHHAAYTTGSDGHDPARDDLTAWHRHWLWPLIDRLPALSTTSRCSDTTCAHSPRTPITLDELSEFLATDLDHRPTPQAPQPKPNRHDPPRASAPRLHPVPADSPDAEQPGHPSRDTMFLSSAAMNEYRARGDAVDLLDRDREGHPRVRLDGHLWAYTHATGGWIRQPDDEDSPA
ncbi:hypothetical protein [Aldersonia kunmingensis]|uniref:hypothetical protein n=1 Tax=Aldersonia kunmingensis TaxID=408066 RepID=UPI00082C5AE0|nr:hypothetical protein [Aldersonia kunmingensis]